MKVGHVRVEHDRRGLGVVPDVELGDGGGVADGRRAAHEHDALEVRRRRRGRCAAAARGWSAGARATSVTGRLVLEDEAAHQLDGAERARGVATSAGGAIPPRPSAPCTCRAARARLEQRTPGAGGDGDVGGAGDVEDAQRVVDDLRERGVAGDAADAEHVDLGVRDGEQDGEGVVDAGVDVEDDGDAHRITVARRPGEAARIACRDASPRAARQRTSRTSWILAEERHVLVGAVGGEAVALVEAVGAGLSDATQR